MPSNDKMIRAEIRKLARQGRLIDECFKVFHARTIAAMAAGVLK